MKITFDQVEQGLDLQKELIAESWKNAEFKELLINNPKAAIAQFTGKSEADITMNIVVQDQSDSNTVYLNLPPKPDIDMFELTEEQLDMVSGGDISCSVGDAIDGVGYTSGAGWGMLARDIWDGITGIFD